MLIRDGSSKAAPGLTGLFSWMTADRLFLVFFVLLVLKVVPGQYGNRIMGGVVWALVAGLLAWRLRQRWGPVHEWESRGVAWLTEHRVEAFCGALLIGGIFISSLMNFDWERHHWPLSPVLMISALACYSFAFLSYGLFRSIRGGLGYGWVLILMLIINIIPLWQWLDYGSIRPILRYTADADHFHRLDISSVFQVRTTYGPFAAIVAVYFWGRVFFVKGHGWYSYGEGLAALSASVGALLCGSRTALVSLLLGLFALFCYVPRGKKAWFAGVAILLVISLHGFALWNPFLRGKVGRVLPYVAKIRQYEQWSWRDFIPKIPTDLTLAKKGGRGQLLKSGLESWRQSPLFGIGLGQYKFVTGKHWNVHNLFLSILCEGGLFVFVAWLYLAGRFVWQWRHSYLMAVVVTIFVISCFENLFDHSLPWVLTCSWIFARNRETTVIGRL